MKVEDDIKIFIKNGVVLANHGEGDLALINDGNIVTIRSAGQGRRSGANISLSKGLL